MKIYITTPVGGAGLWIYEGYKNAWQKAGYDVEFIQTIPTDTPSEYDAMITEVSLYQQPLDTIAPFLTNARRAYLMVQPNVYPEPWGNHPNWRSMSSDEFIALVNSLDNVHLWGFGRSEGKLALPGEVEKEVKTAFFPKWKKINYVPLAFDDIGYQPQKNPAYEFDVCFVGGWADNGFNEKQRIMLEYLGEVSKLKLKMGIFINQGVSIQDEANLQINSKIALNLHDEYQRVVGLDLNERTFKSLGLTGFLVCDEVAEIKNLFPDVPTARTAQNFSGLVDRHLTYMDKEIKDKNRQNILENHTYTNRINSFLEL